jgi:magnesium chelatase family protein
MSLAVVFSRAIAGVYAPLVTVECHLSNGLPNFTIVGLPDTEVKESRDRVRAAILNAQFEFPMRRVIVNLAPADLPKGGAAFDLPIAIAILAASEQLPANALKQYEFVGELALTGEVRRIRGALAMSLASKRSQRSLVLPAANADEAALVKESSVLAAPSLLAVCAHLTQRTALTPHEHRLENTATQTPHYQVDLRDVKGQQAAKRALEVAAAGAHSLLMVGPPGSGKSMLAERIATLLPPMTEDEAMESAAIQSLGTAGFKAEQYGKRPFRSPHHSSSAVAMVGGGGVPKPGEISLSHFGCLFLDELPEFDRRVLEMLREPLESGRITISRAAQQAEFPARFQWISAMNPCPCGFLGDYRNRCKCTPDQVQRYRSKISGPLLDRIDLQIDVPAVKQDELAQAASGETSEVVRARVARARELQLARQGKPNCQLTTPEVDAHCKIDATAGQLLKNAVEKMGLSARAYHRVLKLARTIADLASSTNIAPAHVAEAIQYRKFDRE